MTFGKYQTPKPPTVPTFLQFIKSCSPAIQGKTKFQIDVVWLPGTFDNLTLQTHAFRYVCDSNHPLYVEMQQYLKTEVDKGASPRIDIVIDSIEEREITIVENAKSKGQWEKLGANAYRFKNP